MTVSCQALDPDTDGLSFLLNATPRKKWSHTQFERETKLSAAKNGRRQPERDLIHLPVGSKEGPEASNALCRKPCKHPEKPLAFEKKDG